MTKAKPAGGTSLNPALRPAPPPPLTRDALVEGVRQGDRVALGRAITLLESTRPDHQALAQEVLNACLPATGNAVRVGVTGVPGVGKSTFIEALGLRLIAQGHRLAVLAVDPTSARTRGSILGDKTRMERLSQAEAAFIRPSPTSGALGGVGRATREAGLLCEAAGYDVVLVETVGVGQSEVAVASMVDVFVLLLLAGAGDELQGIKRGIVELADVLVVTKTDQADPVAVRHARADYRSAVGLLPPAPSGWRPPVLTASAVTGDGLDAVWEAVTAYRAAQQAGGFWAARRREQARHWLHQALDQGLRQRFFSHPAVQAALPTLEADVTAGALSSYAAARRLLDLYDARP